MSLFISLLLLLLCIMVASVMIKAEKCSFPPPASGFSNSMYNGRWFEIGKIQTKGGAFFEKDCVCTELNIKTTDEKTGDGLADNDCRDKTATGRWTNATGNLYNEDMSKPGKWLESFTFGGSPSPPVNYTVIAISDDYAVEYDCGTSSAGVTNYCIHVMSRTRTMDSATFKQLIDMAEGMGLNPNSLPVQMTLQSDECDGR